jgi:hypothetical protein
LGESIALWKENDMANEPDDSTVVAGDGPGAGYVQLPGIIALAAYLLVFTLGLIWELHAFWPSCDPTTLNSSTSASTKPAETPRTKPEASPGKTTPPPESSSKLKITSILPTSGDIAGGTSIKITGEGFLDKPTVKLGGSAATDVQMESATSIAAKTPPHAEGAVDVTVTNSDNKTDTLPSGYTYSSSSPSDQASGRCLAQCRSRLPLLVLLAGALGACFHALRSLWMFVGNRDLKRSWALMYIVLPINGAVLAFIFFIVISAGTGFFAQPQGSNSCFWIIGIAALVGLSSQQAAETLKKIAEAVFTGVPKKADSLSSGGLSVTSINPSQGPLAGGEPKVTITGKGFTKNSTVTFDGMPVTSVNFASSTSIEVVPPKGNKPGPVDVVVTDPASNAKDTKAGGFTYSPPTEPPSDGLSITSLDPATGPLAGGTTVTITGKGFTNTSTVTFGGEPGAKLKLGSPTSISVDTPPGKQPGPVDVIVADTASNAKDTKAGGFTYTAS